MLLPFILEQPREICLFLSSAAYCKAQQTIQRCSEADKGLVFFVLRMRREARSQPIRLADVYITNDGTNHFTTTQAPD
jgi:hypothetical protein